MERVFKTHFGQRPPSHAAAKTCPSRKQQWISKSYRLTWKSWMHALTSFYKIAKSKIVEVDWTSTLPVSMNFNLQSPWKSVGSSASSKDGNNCPWCWLYRFDDIPPAWPSAVQTFATSTGNWSEPIYLRRLEAWKWRNKFWHRERWTRKVTENMKSLKFQLQITVFVNQTRVLHSTGLAMTRPILPWSSQEGCHEMKAESRDCDQKTVKSFSRSKNRFNWLLGCKLAAIGCIRQGLVSSPHLEISWEVGNQNNMMKWWNQHLESYKKYQEMLKSTKLKMLSSWVKLCQAGLAACRRWSWWHHHGASKSRCSPSKIFEVLCFVCSSILVVSFTICFCIFVLMMFRYWMICWYWMFRCFGVLMNRRVWSEAIISIISHLRLLSWRVLHWGFYDCSLALRPRPLPTSCAGKGFLQENVACRSWKKLSCETQCDRFDLGLCIIYSLMRLCWWSMRTSCRICRKTSSSAQNLASQIRNSCHILFGFIESLLLSISQKS